LSDRVQGKWSGRLKEIGIEKRSDMPKNAVDKRRPRSGQASGAIMKNLCAICHIGDEK